MTLAPSLRGVGTTTDYAASLLARLGLQVTREDGPADPPPPLLWARSGAMALTGHADGPPLPAPGPLAACAEGAVRALRALAPRTLLPCDGAALLGEHAACFGYTRRGRISPGGSCRLLRCDDGWIALNLARPDDVAALPAWLACDPEEDPWALATRQLARRPLAELLDRALWLSLPVAAAQLPPALAPDWIRVERLRDPARAPAPAERPRVVDLSSLWAGPLCTSLLRDAGADVIKVESAGRPDGARANPRFFDLMNAGKRCVALDFRSEAGPAMLRALVERADVVVEGTRPRALAQLGIDAEAFVTARPGRTWVSITGYGRRDPAPGRVAFGDDAAAAAGLAWATGAREGAPLFCGDAIADPLTGLHAAVAALACWRTGGGRLLDLALADVAGHALGFARVDETALPEPPAPPRARETTRSAAALGADNRAVFRELDLPC